MERTSNSLKPANKNFVGICGQIYPVQCMLYLLNVILFGVCELSLLYG